MTTVTTAVISRQEHRVADRVQVDRIGQDLDIVFQRPGQFIDAVRRMGVEAHPQEMQERHPEDQQG